MATPNYIDSASAWKPTAGLRHGTDEDGKSWLDLPYEEPIGTAENTWLGTLSPSTTTCPVANHTSKVLRKLPDVRHRAAMGYAVLRFEAPSSGGAGDDSPVETTEIKERYTAEIGTSQAVEYIGVYSYDAPIAEVRYTSSSHQSATGYDASSISGFTDPAPFRKEAGSGVFAADADALVKNTDYEIEPYHYIVTQVERGGVWEVTERHELHCINKE